MGFFKIVIFNNFKNIFLYNIALGNYCGKKEFYINPRSPSSSGFLEYTNFKKLVDMRKLDDLLLNYKNLISKVLILIDVEGYELEVLKGSQEFIRNFKPIIIMEYNQTCKFFSLDDVKQILPKEYNFYKLNENGKIEPSLKNTYNIVIMPMR